MPTTLPQPRTSIIRDLIYDNWTPGNVHNYDPSLGTGDADFMPITTDWEEFGASYPSITVTNADGNVINGGETGWTGISSNGLNQYRHEFAVVTIQAEGVDNQAYNGSNSAEDILKVLSDEVERIVQDNSTAPNHSDIYWFDIEPWSDSRDRSEDSPTLFQSQTQVGFGWDKLA